MNNLYRSYLLTPQYGQAMTEALIVFTLFSILLTAVQTTVSMHSSAVDTLIDSSKKVVEVSLGQSVGQNIKQVISEFENAPPVFSAHVLSAELNMASPGFVRASRDAVSMAWRDSRIRRYSFLETGNGYGSSDQNVQARIAQSRSAWKDAFKYSSESIRSIESLTSKTDNAWKRPGIQLDFLMPWAGVIPKQNLSVTPVPTSVWRHAWGN